jgi:hypothetical protein
MSLRPVVFLGPSLSHVEASVIVEAHCRPLLRAGDLDAVPDSSFVGIVDGVLTASSRVSPCEAVRALNRGVRLYGAASTGALLAARLCEAGFIGFVRVFALVARYPDAADDLVAVLYADPNRTPFTEQLANAVFTLIDHRRPADPWLVEEAIEALQTIPIEKRTPSALNRRLRLAAIHGKDDAAVGRRHVGIDVVGEHDLGVGKLRADELHEERRRFFIAPAQFDQAAFEKVVVLGGETARERPERL